MVGSERTHFKRPLAMPFGKYRGLPLEQVPTPYLQWLLRETDLRAFLREAVEREMRFRGAETAEQMRPAAPVPVTWPSIVRRWHWEVAIRFHPDRGGSPEAMEAINHAVDRLKELLAL